MCLYNYKKKKLKRQKNLKPTNHTNQNTQQSSLTCLIFTDICIYSNFHGRISIVSGCLLSHSFSYINWIIYVESVQPHFSHFLCQGAESPKVLKQRVTCSDGLNYCLLKENHGLSKEPIAPASPSQKPSWFIFWVCEEHPLLIRLRLRWPETHFLSFTEKNSL